MKFIEITKMAVASLTVNKLRSTLTMLGIIIGNASVIALVGLTASVQNYTSEKIESFGVNRLMVFQSNEDDKGITLTDQKLVLSDAEIIKIQAPAVKKVAPVIALNLTINHSGKQASTLITGTTKEFLYVRNFEVAQGRFFDSQQQKQNAQEIVLGPEVANKLFENSSPLGKEVQINNISFEVVGVMKAKGSFGGENEDDAAYMPLLTMSSQLDGNISPYGIPINYIQISAQDKNSIRAATFQITNVLTRLHGEKDFTIVANKSFQELLMQITSVMSLMLGSIASISLVVGGIGIMNIMLVSVTERTSEIGLRKAVGANNRSILFQFLMESVILSVIGGLVGILIGIAGIMIIGVFTPLKPIISFPTIILALGISSSTGLISGVLPARQAARLDPIVALRSN